MKLNALQTFLFICLLNWWQMNNLKAIKPSGRSLSLAITCPLYRGELLFVSGE